MSLALVISLTMTINVDEQMQGEDYHFDLQFSTDAYYAAPVTKSSKLHSAAGSFTYMYVNNYNFSTGALNPGTRWMPYWMGRWGYNLIIINLGKWGYL